MVTGVRERSFPPEEMTAAEREQGLLCPRGWEPASEYCGWIVRHSEAVNSGDPNRIAAWLQFVKDPNVTDEQEETTLEIVAARGHVEGLKVLLADPRVQIEIPRYNTDTVPPQLTRKGWTILHSASGSTRSADVIKVLLADPRIDPNAKADVCLHPDYIPPRRNITPLYEAAACGNSIAVKALLEDPRTELNTIVQDPAMMSGRNVTPLYAAARGGYRDITAMLCERGIDPNPILEEALARHISPEALDYLRPLGIDQANKILNIENIIECLLPLVDQRSEGSPLGIDQATKLHHTETIMAACNP